MAVAVAVVVSPAGYTHDVLAHGDTVANAIISLKAKIATIVGTVVGVSTIDSLSTEDDAAIVFGTGRSQNATLALRPDVVTDGVIRTINYPIMDLKTAYSRGIFGQINVGDAAIETIATAFTAAQPVYDPPITYGAWSGRFRKKFSKRGNRRFNRGLKG